MKPPDPADPRVYEAVVKLAIEKNKTAYGEELAAILNIEEQELNPYVYGYESDDVDAIAAAPPEQRLRAALKVLGELEE